MLLCSQWPPSNKKKARPCLWGCKKLGLRMSVIKIFFYNNQNCTLGDTGFFRLQGTKLGETPTIHTFKYLFSIIFQILWKRAVTLMCHGWSVSQTTKGLLKPQLWCMIKKPSRKLKMNLNVLVRAHHMFSRILNFLNLIVLFFLEKNVFAIKIPVIWAFYDIFLIAILHRDLRNDFFFHFFFNTNLLFFQFLFGLLFPLFYLDFCFPFSFGLLFLF